MYQALYRKWRPRTFDEVVGQSEVTETLKSQIISGRLSHAYLFVGTRGTGKTSCAKILARAVNCEHPENGNPCNKCKSCLGIEDGSIMDVVELDAASNNGVDNVRALRDEAVYSPAVVKKRVYIIDEVHMLSTSAFNALLKILEEPPEHLIFILATTELGKVPATVLSRCQRHRFRRLDADTIAERIRYVAGQEKMDLEPEAADLLATLADGSMRDGLSLLDQCGTTQPITAENVRLTIGLSEKSGTVGLLSAITDGRTEDAVGIFEKLWREGSSPAAVLSELCALLRDILIIRVAPRGGRELLSAGFDPNSLKSFASRMTNDEIMSDMDSIMGRIGTLRDGRDPKMTAELCIIGLCDPELGDDLNSLRARVDRLERSGVNIPSPAPKEPEKASSLFKEAMDTDESPFDIPEPQKVSDKDNEISQKDVPVPDTVEKAPEPGTEPPDSGSSAEEAAACTDGSSLWEKLRAELTRTMPPYFSAHLSDASAEMDGGALVIGVTSGFKKMQLEKPEPQKFIRDAMTSVAGAPIPFRITETTASAKDPDPKKLDDLLKFGNVKCE